MVLKINKYKADLRELKFVLFEQFRIQELMGQAPFENWGQEEANMVIDEVYKYATTVSGPLFQSGDQEGCTLEGGRVRVPSGFKEAWQAVHEQGWRCLDTKSEFGGQEAPYSLQLVADELITGSNLALAMYLTLTFGAAELIEAFGTPEQREQYCAHMFQGRWAGTMCLTEPHAGTDVGDAKTTAKRRDDGSYLIKGTKIFISAGDHDLTDNIIHMVLARTEGAPPGTKGLSLFIVPAVLPRGDGSLGERNDVLVASIEHKMGIKGSSTCVLNFGDEGRCVGYLCGDVEQRGIMQMFQMMNGARIAVGLSGYATASPAYLNALDYAKERKQGSKSKDPTAPRVPIIEHADVRRMMLDMKARVEGCRALGILLATHVDRAHAAEGTDEERASFHRGQVELLTPLLKSYATDQAFQVCQTAIQSYGGAGFLQDHPAEQYCRDSKILAIYEGTNHIQALDLVGRKLRLVDGKYVEDYKREIGDFITKNAGHSELGDSVELLREAFDALIETLASLGRGVEVERVPLVANAVLEMMSEVTVSWLLTSAAVVACAAHEGVADGHPDRAFYAGKVQAARYYAANVLPGSLAKARVIAGGDRSALDIPDAAFATV